MSSALKLMTVEEFLPWAEGKERRWELYDGVPVMIAPERSLHAETKGEAYTALREAIRLKALSCRVYPDGMAVRVDARTTFEPDASVTFGPRAPADAIEITDPVIVVEVLSPSTVAVDHGRKLSGYFSLASVQHYLILDPDRRVVIHHKRGTSDAIETRVLTDGAARLDPPGFEVAVETLFPPPDQSYRSGAELRT
jgi:Uma2 family endonuclease